MNPLEKALKFGAEIHGEIGDVRDISTLTTEEIGLYGLDADFVQSRPNLKIIEADLFFVGEEFCPKVSLDEAKGSHFILPRDAVERNLRQLKNMPIHVNATLTGHADNENGEDKFNPIGVIIGQRLVEGKDGVSGRILGGLWEANHPEVVDKISKNKMELGSSMELKFSKEGLVQRGEEDIFVINDFTFTGAAILAKEKCAFPKTQLLVAERYVASAEAQKGENSVDKGDNIKGDLKMLIEIKSDGTREGTVVTIDGSVIANLKNFIFSLSPEEYQKEYGNKNEAGISCSYGVVDESSEDGVKKSAQYSLSAEGEVKVFSQKAEGGEKRMKTIMGITLEKDTYTLDEVAVILTGISTAAEKSAADKTAIESLQAEKDTIKAEKDALLVKVETLEAEKETAEKTRVEALAGEKGVAFWVENEKMYAESAKDEVIAIATKIELGTATAEEMKKIVSLKSAESSLHAEGGDTKDAEAKGKELDQKYGISNAGKKQ